MSNIAKLFRIDAENYELMGAQVAAFSRQVPLLYFILSVLCFGVYPSWHGAASLTVAFPAFCRGRAFRSIWLVAP
jgi:predicted signal transduction protein with EAL and GGDEF domain